MGESEERASSHTGRDSRMERAPLGSVYKAYIQVETTLVHVKRYERLVALPVIIYLLVVPRNCIVLYCIVKKKL